MRKTSQGLQRPDADETEEALLKRFGPKSMGSSEPGAPPRVVPSLDDVCFVSGGKQIDQALYFVAVCRGPRQRPKRQRRERSSAEESPHDPAR